jgi:hypothetical protein
LSRPYSQRHWCSFRKRRSNFLPQRLLSLQRLLFRRVLHQRGRSGRLWCLHRMHSVEGAVVGQMLQLSRMRTLYSAEAAQMHSLSFPFQTGLQQKSEMSKERGWKGMARALPPVGRAPKPDPPNAKRQTTLAGSGGREEKYRLSACLCRMRRCLWRERGPQRRLCRGPGWPFRQSQSPRSACSDWIQTSPQPSVTQQKQTRRRSEGSPARGEDESCGDGARGAGER